MIKSEISSTSEDVHAKSLENVLHYTRYNLIKNVLNI